MIDQLRPRDGQALDWAAITDAFPWIQAMRGSTQDPNPKATP